MLKYPLVLVHGIAASDRIGLIDFWGRIPELLRQRGIAVYFGNTDSWGDYESNAELLRASIDAALKETKAEKVNLLAHSKGGIDARYLIWKRSYGDRVASLTTISTPHRGAELADLLLRQKPLKSMAARKALKVLGKLFGDENADPLRALQEISTANMAKFNETVLDDERVYYRSYYTVMDGSLDDFAYFFSHWYLMGLAGPNDGVVSEASARYWENCKELKGKSGGISHAEILDIKKKRISGIEIPDFYLSVIEELELRGF